jgi:hypothetical protein
MFQRGVSCLLEVEERKAVKLAGNTALREKRLDEVLSAVGGSGIADYPSGDVIGDCTKAAIEVRHLVLHDHIEAERLARRHFQVIRLASNPSSRAAEISEWSNSGSTLVRQGRITGHSFFMIMQSRWSPYEYRRGSCSPPMPRVGAQHPS